MRMPKDEAFDRAIMWLEVYEGDDKELCQSVIEWIEHERRERMIRNGARASGVPTAVFRRRLATMYNAVADAACSSD